MQIESGRLIVIGENINATRKIKASSPRVVERGGVTGIGYTDEQGSERVLDCMDILPTDPDEREYFLIPHIAQALKSQDLNYLTWILKAQEQAGAQIIDICVDEMSPYPEERHEWMRGLVRTVQSITSAVLSIDSSDTDTIRAGLEVYDRSISQPAINSFNLEEGREELAEVAHDTGAILFANASGREGMPHSAQERVENLATCMEIMDRADIAMSDRYLDPLVFPVGAEGSSGNAYLDAVSELRARYPEVHIFGGHSNVSFGLPNRSLLNYSFTLMSIAAGCDAVMIDPIMNSPKPFIEFRYASEVLKERDEFGMNYMEFCRAES